jgi:hypothetical protein
MVWDEMLDRKTLEKSAPDFCAKLGQSESETMRKAFLDYAEKLNLVSEKIQENFHLFQLKGK